MRPCKTIEKKKKGREGQFLQQKFTAIYQIFTESSTKMLKLGYTVYNFMNVGNKKITEELDPIAQAGRGGGGGPVVHALLTFTVRI